MFVVSDNNQASIFFATSNDAGVTWTGKPMATGADGFPVAFGNPSVATDKFGNLFIAYETVDTHAVEVLMSYDTGRRFTSLTGFGPLIRGRRCDRRRFGVGGISPAAANGRHQGDLVRRRGGVRSSVTGLGRVGSFKPEVINDVQSNVHDLAVGPAGQVRRLTFSRRGRGRSRFMFRPIRTGWGSWVLVRATIR